MPQLTEDDLINLLQADPLINKILNIIEKNKQTTLYLCAGTIRNFVWDQLTNNSKRQLTDIDVVLYDTNISYEETCLIQKKLNECYPEFEWEVKNQVFMHGHNPGTEPYHNFEHALASFPETCTAIALRKNESDYELIAPHGIVDLVNLEVRPTPHFLASQERLTIYQNRVRNKQWTKIWPDLKIFNLDESN